MKNLLKRKEFKELNVEIIKLTEDLNLHFLIKNSVAFLITY